MEDDWVWSNWLEYGGSESNLVAEATSAVSTDLFSLWPRVVFDRTASNSEKIILGGGSGTLCSAAFTSTDVL